MYGDVGGFFGGPDRFPEKIGMFEDVWKKQMWTKKPLGDLFGMFFVWQMFWGGYGIWNRVFSPISLQQSVKTLDRFAGKPYNTKLYTIEN